MLFEGGAGHIVDILHLPNVPRGEVGPGTIHHVAFRTREEADLPEWQDCLKSANLEVTNIRDRKYFHSIYVDEPGGALIEIATDSPGFMVDESLAELGSRLQLPPRLEPDRDAIVQNLPGLE